MILRKKAISVKQSIDSQGYPPNEAPSVYYIVLTSCDEYGRPEFPVTFFDGSTKRSFKKHNIKVITVHDLVLDFKTACPDWDGKSDLFQRSNETDYEKNQRLAKIFEGSSRNLVRGMMVTTNIGDGETLKEFQLKMQQNGINFHKALLEANRRLLNLYSKDSYSKASLPDVYIMLFSFIKRHRKDHVFVDELPILTSKFSKLNLYLTHSN